MSWRGLEALGFAGSRDIVVHRRRATLTLKLHVLRRRVQVAMPPIEHPDERVVEVVDQMPTAGDLRGLRGAERSALGIATRSVAADDLDTRTPA
jgi:hypothetical protein